MFLGRLFFSIFIELNVLSVTVIVVGNLIGDMSLNLGLGYLCSTLCNGLGKAMNPPVFSG